MSSSLTGEIAPPFVLPTHEGSDFDLVADSVAGQFIAIIFCPAGIAAAADQLASFAEHHASLRDKRVLVVAVSKEPVADLAVHRERLHLPFDLLSDSEGKQFAGYRIAAGSGAQASQPATLLLRPNRHILTMLHEGPQAEEVSSLVDQQMDLENDAAVGFRPPILMVPDVLTREDCRWLIDVYNREDVPLIDIDRLEAMRERGEVNSDVKVMMGDYGRQDRIDFYVISQDVRARISQRLQTRLLPEIRKAFHYPVGSYEGLSITCYEGARGGHAHGHRDDSHPDVADRRFALSINLNAEEFEGGGIRFPEFGQQHYRGATGAGLVFSCSLLHEVLEIDKGRRYVLLVFLKGAQ